MQDRVSLYPGRIKLTPVSGQTNVYDMVRADQPTKEGTALNKANLLKDATAALFGLGENAVPDDVFGVLSRFQSGLGNEYVWIKGGITPSHTTLNSVGQKAVYKTGYSSRTLVILASNSIELSVNGEVSLSDEYLYNATFGTVDSYVRGKYFFVDPSSTDGYTELTEGKIYYIPTDAETYKDNSNYYVYFSPVYEVVGVAEKFDIVGYVNSSDPNAYPPAIDDGYTYIPLGQLGEKTRIATGSYTGTGTYGKDNPTQIVFPFEPKVVHIMHISAPNMRAVYLNGCTYMNTAASGANSPYAACALSETTLSWYNTSSAANQLNTGGNTFYYLAIG